MTYNKQQIIMTDKEKFTMHVISGLCANDKYTHEAIHSKDGLAVSVVRDAKKIADEFFKDDTPTA